MEQQLLLGVAHMILIFIWKCHNLSITMQIMSCNKTSQDLISYEEKMANNEIFIYKPLEIFNSENNLFLFFKIA